MSQRGDYRAVYSVLLDSDEYKRLSKDAKLLWHGVKHSCGLAGIEVVYDDQLAERSGISVEELGPARRELIRERWIQVEGRVHWLINGLRFEPNVTLTNPKQRAGIERHLRGLPKLQIVSRMAAHYGLTDPFPGSHKDGSGNPSDTHSDGPRFTETLTLAVDVAGDGDGDGNERGSCARAEVASLDGRTPDFDGYVPTDDQRTRAAELHVDLDSALRKWRGTRKANGATPVDLVADFDAWLEREPQYASSSNGNGRHEEPDRGIVRRFEQAPAEPDGPETTAEEKAAGREAMRRACATPSSASTIDPLAPKRGPLGEAVAAILGPPVPAQLDTGAAQRFEESRARVKAQAAAVLGKQVPTRGAPA